MATEYVIDGSRITSLETFYDEIGHVLIPGHQWGRNLDAFNDILRGGFGTPDEGFTLKWSHSAVSKEKLGYPETVRQLEIRLARCHPSNREEVRRMCPTLVPVWARLCLIGWLRSFGTIAPAENKTRTTFALYSTNVRFW